MTDQLPRRAEDYLRMLHEDFQQRWDRLFADEKPSDQERANLAMIVQDFSQIYLLGVLHQIAPETAEQATEVLADLLDAGDSLGEWAHQWRQELENGQPMTLLFGETTPEQAAIDTVARHAVRGAVFSEIESGRTGHETYPELTEADWDAVSFRARQIADSIDTSREAFTAAYELLEERGKGQPA